MNNPEHLTYSIDKNRLRIGAALGVIVITAGFALGSVMHTSSSSANEPAAPVTDDTTAAVNESDQTTNNTSNDQPVADKESVATETNQTQVEDTVEIEAEEAKVEETADVTEAEEAEAEVDTDEADEAEVEETADETEAEEAEADEADTDETENDDGNSNGFGWDFGLLERAVMRRLSMVELGFGPVDVRTCQVPCVLLRHFLLVLHQLTDLPVFFSGFFINVDPSGIPFIEVLS